MLLQVSRSAFYAYRVGAPCQRERDDAELTGAIAAAHDKSTGTYGAPRIHTRRRHSTLDYLSPATYEARINQQPGLRQVA